MKFELSPRVVDILIDACVCYTECYKEDRWKYLRKEFTQTELEEIGETLEILDSIKLAQDTEDKSTNTESDLINRAEVARILGVSVYTVQAWGCRDRKTHDLPYIIVGRYAMYERSKVLELKHKNVVAGRPQKYITIPEGDDPK